MARSRLQALLRQFPIVTILGPRQIGKSTFASWVLPDYELLDLEDRTVFLRVEEDTALLLAQSRKTIIDEAQRLPALFPILRHFVDHHPHHKVVLLGSASPALVRSISESLAGRTGFLELSGISVREEKEEPLWTRGGFPRLHWSRPRATPQDWLSAFLKTYAEQDIPQLGFRLPAQNIMRLLTMIAHSQGSLCNLSELGASLGLNYHSVSHLLDIFEGTFLVRRLAPYHANLSKRLVKSPKIYIRDTGILHHLLGIGFTQRDLLSHPKAGASFETFCLEQIMTLARLEDPGAEAFFFRTQAGLETDLILRLRGELIAIEIKLSLSSQSLRSLGQVMSDLHLQRGFVVTVAHEMTQVKKNVWAGPLAAVLDRLLKK